MKIKENKMDMHGESKRLLCEVFGISPDYEVVWTDAENVEFCTPDVPQWKEWYARTYPDDRFMSPNKIHLHLDEHNAITESGIRVVANFAVHHPSKRVWLRLLVMTGNRYNKFYAKAYQNG